MNTKIRVTTTLFLTFLVTLFSMFGFVSSVHAALYPFGGRIISINSPLPFGPCYSGSISVGAPRPGVFVIPPNLLASYRWYQWSWVGAKVLGTATNRSCGVIMKIGTSLF